MNFYIGITDRDWFDLHKVLKPDEVNFWKPSSDRVFRALSPGEPFLFKLHSPDNFIVGGGFFTRFMQLPLNMAWETFGQENGVQSLDEMRNRISFYRRKPLGRAENPNIGCIMLAEPFFWEEDMWVIPPEDFQMNIVQGKTYDAAAGFGKEAWEKVELNIQARLTSPDEQPASVAALSTHGFGQPREVVPRLGQGLFRVYVTEIYERRCALSGERTLPVLDAAHIRPYSESRRHDLNNGLLLRSDLHRLFDLGYITVDPQSFKTVVSPRIKEQFENGRDYYKFQGQPIRQPENPLFRPSTENLRYHADVIFH